MERELDEFAEGNARADGGRSQGGDQMDLLSVA